MAGLGGCGIDKNSPNQMTKSIWMKFSFELWWVLGVRWIYGWFYHKFLYDWTSTKFNNGIQICTLEKRKTSTSQSNALQSHVVVQFCVGSCSFSVEYVSGFFLSPRHWSLANIRKEDFRWVNGNPMLCNVFINNICITNLHLWVCTVRLLHRIHLQYYTIYYIISHFTLFFPFES